MYGSSGAKMWDRLRLGAVVGPFRDHFEGLNAVKNWERGGAACNRGENDFGS